MKLVLCAINSKYVHSALAPYYLKAAMGETDCHILEGNINSTDGTLLRQIYESRPDILGFSCYIWNISLVRRLLPAIRRVLPQCRLILGGPEVSFHCGALLEELTMVDYILAGEGEESLPQLVSAIKCGDDSGLPLISGLSYRKQGEIVTNPVVEATFEPPDPYTPAYLAAISGRMAYFESSRGCPYSCAFCLSGRAGNVRFFSLDNVKNQLLRLIDSGCTTIKFVDRTFNCHKERAYQLFEFLISIPVPMGVCFHFEIAAELLDEKTLALLATAPKGRFQFEAGLQSFHEPTLAAIHRPANNDLLEKNLRALLRMGNCHLHIDLIAGLPFEGFTEFKASFSRAFSIAPHMLQLGFLKLLKGAPLESQQEGWSLFANPNPPYEILSTQWLSFDQLLQLKTLEEALDRVYNSGRFQKTLAYALENGGLSPFDFFLGLGTYVEEQHKLGALSQDRYTQLFLDFLKGTLGLDEGICKEKLIFDCLTTQRGGKLPTALKNYEIDNKALQKNLLSGVYDRENSPYSLLAKQGLCGAFPLKEGVLLCDYRMAHPVTGLYTHHLIKNLR